MIALLIWILALILIFGLIVWIINQLPLPPPFGNIAIAIIGLILVLILVGMLLGDVPLRPVRLQ